MITEDDLNDLRGAVQHLRMSVDTKYAGHKHSGHWHAADRIESVLKKLEAEASGTTVTDHAGRELHLISGARAPITMIAELANPIDVAPPFGPSGNLVIVRVPETCYIGVVKEKK